MKYIIFFFLISSLLLSCSENENSTTDNVQIISEDAENKTLYSVLGKIENTKTFYALASQTVWMENLQDSLRNFTIFVPTDDAFQKLSKENFDKVKTNAVFMREMLENHIIEGKIMIAEIEQVSTLKNIAQKEISIEKNEKNITIQKSNIVQSNVVANNGVIHIVDKVW